jgi:hypothetical protein
MFLMFVPVQRLFSQNCSSFSAVISKRDITCKGNYDGLATVVVTGGTAPYKYSWSEQMGEQPSTPSVLYPGTFTCTITDASNCQLIKNISIIEPDEISVSFSVTPSQCGNSSGSIFSLVTGGTGQKKYYWTHSGDTTPAITGISAGEYTLIVRDKNGCSSIAKAQVEDSNGPVIFSKTITKPTCFNGKNGKIEIQVSGGQSPYLYSWSGTNQTTSLIKDIKAGTYAVKITNAAGCITIDTSIVNQPDTFKVELNVTHTNHGAGQGHVSAQVIGGTPPYSYSWENSNSHSNSLQGLNRGKGNVTVTDSNGCTITSNYEVQDLNGPVVTPQIISHDKGFLKGKGKAKVNVSGGQPPYTYSWWPRGGNQQMATDLIGDNYKVTVTDNNGSVSTSEFTIETPEELKVYIYVVPPSGYGLSDGAAYSIVYGGVPPYTYLWSTGETTNNIFNLPVGTDSLFVTDSQGVTAMNAVAINYAESCTPGSHTIQPYCTPYIPTGTNPTMDIKLNFLAVGDGIADDECAFEAASDYFATLDPAIPKKLIIPYGHYLVGAQDEPWQARGNDVLFFDNIQNLTIEGQLHPNYHTKPIIKFRNCMKYGAFDLPFNPDHRLLHCNNSPTDWPPCDPNGNLSGLYCRIMTPGTMIHLGNCHNVLIKNLELHGNVDNMNIGGRYTEGIQIPYDGIYINASTDVTIENVDVHHFGRDGMIVYFNLCPPGLLDEYVPYFGPEMNMMIKDSKFNNNCRTGLVWGGGVGLTAENCEFNHTGQGRFESKIMSGLNIEYEASNVGNMNGSFNNCRFKYNKYSGMICDAGWGGALNPNGSIFTGFTTDFYSRNVDFIGCTFVGSETGSTCWPNSRNFNFRFCEFYGRTWKAFYSPIPGSHFNFDNTKFFDCLFSEEYTDPEIFPPVRKSISVGHDLDKGTTDIATGCPNPNHSWCVEFSTAMRVLLQNCTIVTNFNLKTINLSADVVPPFFPAINLDSWNVFENVWIWNYGLNTCGCDDPNVRCDAMVLNSVNFTKIQGGDSHQRDWLGIRNPGSFCSPPQSNCGLSWYIHGDQQSWTQWIPWPLGASWVLNHCQNSWWCNNPNVCFINELLCYPDPWWPLSEEYYNPVDPNFVNLYPDPVNCNASTYFTTESLPYSCNPATQFRKKKQESLVPLVSIYPNPSIDILNVKNAIPGNEFKIFSILGEVVYSKVVTEPAFEIDARSFSPGVHFIRTGDSKSIKFIKL